MVLPKTEHEKQKHLSINFSKFKTKKHRFDPLHNIKFIMFCKHIFVTILKFKSIKHVDLYTFILLQQFQRHIRRLRCLKNFSPIQESKANKRLRNEWKRYLRGYGQMRLGLMPNGLGLGPLGRGRNIRSTWYGVLFI